MTGAEAWADALLAARLLAVDPEGLGGATLRARAGPARDAWLEQWSALAPDRPAVRLPPGIGDERLLGGLDLAATLAAGRPVQTAGLLAEAAGRTLILPMAERAGAGLAGRLNAARDAGCAFALILLDEGAEADEAAPVALSDRLAFRPVLEGLTLADLATDGAAADIAAARAALPGVAIPDELTEALAGVAMALGIGSLRAPILALRAARAAAALMGAARVEAEAAEIAVRLVLAPRATQLPAQEEEPESAEPPPEPEQETELDPREDDPAEHGGDEGRIPEEVLLEAARAAIPPDLLARLMARAALRGPSGGTAGAGDERKTRARGRPAGSVKGMPRDGARVDLIETLRSAAPWQPMRRAAPGADGGRVLVRAEDFRIKRAKRRAEKVVIFVVDASGSTALARLAEAKGAIELMLGQAYVARQQVALIAFRAEGAEVLLPPTRSLVMTKRRLARLPGGGGTPLAAGLQAALELAAQSAARGVEPHLAVLTDGRANIALDGMPDRPAAAADAERIGRAIRAAGRRAVVIDTGNRPSQEARRLAEAMAAGYLPLPRADAARLSGAMQAALDGAA